MQTTVIKIFSLKFLLISYFILLVDVQFLRESIEQASLEFMKAQWVGNCLYPFPHLPVFKLIEMSSFLFDKIVVQEALRWCRERVHCSKTSFVWGEHWAGVEAKEETIISKKKTNLRNEESKNLSNKKYLTVQKQDFLVNDQSRMQTSSATKLWN